MIRNIIIEGIPCRASAGLVWPHMQQAKTQEEIMENKNINNEYMIIGNPGGDRWELVCYCDDLEDAQCSLKAYKENVKYPVAIAEYNEETRFFLDEYTNLAGENQRLLQRAIASLATLEATSDSDQIISHIASELRKARTKDLQMIDNIITRLNQQAEHAYNAYCDRFNGTTED